MSKIEDDFRSLGRTKKVEFIDENIRYASADAVAEYVETYIYDFNRDVYGEYIEVVLHRFVRPEIKFENMEQLKKQIQQDIKDSVRS